MFLCFLSCKLLSLSLKRWMWKSRKANGLNRMEQWCMWKVEFYMLDTFFHLPVFNKDSTLLQHLKSCAWCMLGEERCALSQGICTFLLDLGESTMPRKTCNGVASKGNPTLIDEWHHDKIIIIIMFTYLDAILVIKVKNIHFVTGLLAIRVKNIQL